MTEQFYSEDVIKSMVEGKLSPEAIREMITSPKDLDRFEKYVSVLQKRVSWADRILLRVGEHLFIVQKADGSRITKCECGFEFGDYRADWKLNALIYVRNTNELLEELWPWPITVNPDWCEIREYYCPNCCTQLWVEGLPPGYPIIQEFLPDIDTFYRDWLGKPLEHPAEFTDKTPDLLREWKKDIEDSSS